MKNTLQTTSTIELCRLERENETPGIAVKSSYFSAIQEELFQRQPYGGSMPKPVGSLGVMPAMREWARKHGII